MQPYERPEFKPEEWGSWTSDVESSFQLHPVSNLGNAIRWESFCGILGTPGLTGWVGFEEYAKAKPGETIFVSSAASGVGQYVYHHPTFTIGH